MLNALWRQGLELLEHNNRIMEISLLICLDTTMTVILHF